MLAIIDGDVLAYQACKNRNATNRLNQNDEDFVRLDQADVVTQPQATGEETQVIYLDQEGRKIRQDTGPKFTPEEDTKYLEVCWETFKKDLDRLMDKLFCTDYIMAVKGEVEDFRKGMYPDYKMNRHGKPQTNPAAEFVPFLRQLAVHEGYAVPANGREADDLLRTWANEARRAGQEHIICSIDKDLRCIPGKHYIMHFDPKKQLVIDVSEEEGMRHYYEQLLKGDPTDNIPGVPRVGEVKAAKLISGCLTEKDMQECVVEQYLIAYGERDWYNMFLSNAKMIHLQNHQDDYFDCRHWPIIQELCA